MGLAGSVNQVITQSEIGGMGMTNKSNNKEANNRLRWKCRRGMLELDIMLQSFLKDGYTDLNQEDSEYFEQLLDYEDNPLLELLMGHMQPANPAMKGIIASIQYATCPKD